MRNRLLGALIVTALLTGDGPPAHRRCLCPFHSQDQARPYHRSRLIRFPYHPRLRRLWDSAGRSARPRCTASPNETNSRPRPCPVCWSS